MSAVIYNVAFTKVIGSYSTVGRAHLALRNAVKKGHLIQGRRYNHERLNQCLVTTLEDFDNNIDHDVEVMSLNAYGGEPKLVTIRASQRGGPCDPSTELYWSM